MRYINEVAVALKIQDLVDEKGLSRQCLFQLRDKQTGLENLKNLEKVYFKFNYSMKKSSQLQRMLLNDPQMVAVINQIRETYNQFSESMCQLLISYFEEYGVTENIETFAENLKEYWKCSNTQIPTEYYAFDFLVFSALKEYPITQRILFQNCFSDKWREEWISKYRKEENWREELPKLIQFEQLPEFYLREDLFSVLCDLKVPGVLRLYQIAGELFDRIQIHRSKDYFKAAEWLQKIKVKLESLIGEDLFPSFFACLIVSANAVGFQEKLLCKCYQYMEEHPEMLAEIFKSKYSFLNVCTGFRYSNIFVSVQNECVFDLLTYAIEQNKKSFLRLLQENVDELKDFSDYSLLWKPDFWKICNLNSLNKKDLLSLKNKTAISLDILKDYGPFTFQEILTVGKQCDKIQRIYVDLDSALGIDEKLKRIRQLCHESMEWDRISWNDIPVISQMLSRESLVSYRDRHNNIKGSVFEWLQLMLAEKKHPELTSMIKEAKDENDLQILVKNQDNKELLSRGLLGFKDQFIYLDPDSIWLVGKLQKEELLDALKMFCLSGGAAIAHAYYNSVNEEKQRENLLLIVKAILYGKLDEIKYDNFSMEVGYTVPQKMKEIWKKSTSIYRKHLSVAEYTDFWHCMNIGILPGRTCMSYEDGMYNECLLSVFDANKKILYVKKEGVILGRAILRLTKISDHPKNALCFEDVEQTEEDISENLVLFLEKSYQNGYSGKQKEAIQRLLIALTKEKAKKMGVNLLLADEYTQLPEIKHLEKKNTHVYISCSKNGKQYLDSLGGNCEIGGYYRQRELPYWRCEED